MGSEEAQLSHVDAIVGSHTKNVVKILIEFSNVFRQLCSKLNNKFELEKIQDFLAITMCHMEKIFPPSFFNIMEHLPIHLAVEASMAGAVQFRWMYPIGRFVLL
ncbi:hypothetical protein ACH5RR_018246 [Cinchona calisaya]|uniref:DUF4218 domain-containing protein n=1 Tax=Cinchona calisaya TaxID=153742 RepID=A0ABD2ZPL8_9GENT